MLHDLIIIGSGPAGYTAAIYAARADMKPLMFAGLEPGGQLMLTSDVENWPGEHEGILGPELMEKFKQQALRFGTDIKQEMVTKVDFSKRPFTITTSDGTEYQSKTVIVATGASARWLNVPGEAEYKGKGVSACATCDGFFFKNQEIAVIGGGDSAMEEATFLTKFASKVTVIHRSEEFKASKIMLDRAKKNPKIKFIMNTVVDEVLGKDKISALKLRNAKTGEITEFPVGGMFVAIGHAPNTSLFKDQLNFGKMDYLTVQPGSTKTNIEGVFAAGDVADHYYRQAVTAAGTGCMAALDAERWLASQEH